jgi:hypothetical protein
MAEMLGRWLLTHYDRVRRAVAALSQPSAFAFGAACAERDWLVYERASTGKRWARREVLRSNLNAIWSWLEGKAEQPHISAVACEQAIPSASDDLLDDLGFQVANIYFGLVALVEDDNTHPIHTVAQSNLDLIDAFLYELSGLPVTAENDAAVDAHELVQAEVKRQLEDLELLATSATPALVEQVKRRALGVDLLKGCWP